MANVERIGEPTGPLMNQAPEGLGHSVSVPCAARVYRIDQHGPYRRWILVCDGEDVSAHKTIAEARVAMERHKADQERTGV